MRIFDLNPHPDDSSLSAYFIIKYFQNLGHTFTTATVATFPETVRDNRKFAELMGMEFVHNDMTTDLNFKENRIDIFAVKKMRDSYTYQENFYMERFPEDYKRVLANVEKLLKSHAWDKILTTTGLLHPMHMLVLKSIKQVLGSDKDILYYADSPYQFRKYGEKLLKDSGVVPLKSFVGTNEDVDQKLKVFWDSYPTERQMLRFDKGLYYGQNGSEKLFNPPAYMSGEKVA